MSFIKGFIIGGVAVFIVYHFALQPILQKWRDEAKAKLEDKFGPR